MFKHKTHEHMIELFILERQLKNISKLKGDIRYLLVFYLLLTDRSLERQNIEHGLRPPSADKYLAWESAHAYAAKVVCALLGAYFAAFGASSFERW